MVTLLTLALAAGISAGQPEVPATFQTRFLGRKDGLSNLTVRDITCDREGEIWIATRDGLNRFDGYSFTVYRTDPDNPSSIGCNVIECLEPGDDGRLWIGTDMGLSCYDPKVRKFFNFPIPSGHVLDIVQLDGKTLFLRSGPTGLLFDIPSSRFIDRYGPARPADYKKLVMLNASGQVYCSSANRIEMVEKDSLRLIVELKGPIKSIKHIGNTLWLCRNDHSLHTYDIGTSSLSEYREEGLFDITRDVEQIDGSLFFATSKGLMVKKDGSSPRTFDIFPPDGSGYNIPVNTLQKDHQGGLWITSFHDGICRLNSDPPETFSPDPVLTGISVNGENLLPTKGGMLEEDIRFLDKIRLRGKVTELRILFSVINHASMGDNTFSYILEGYERNWHEQDNRSPAVYKDLKKGRYIFRLRSANNQGVWSENERTLNIYIGSNSSTILLIILLAGIPVFLFFIRHKRKREPYLRIASSYEGVEYIFDGINALNQSSGAEDFLKKAIRTIEDNIEDPDYSSSKLARDLGMSRSAMYNRLAQISGIGAGKLMYMIRLNIARHLLSSGKYSIEEVAEKIGFSNASYFSLCFKKQFGKPPKSFLPIVAILLCLNLPVSAQDSNGPVFREIPLPEPMSEKMICSICQDTDGFLWLTDGEEIVRYDGHVFTSHGFKGHNGTAPSIRQLSRDMAGRLWATTSEGAWLYDPLEKHFSDVLNLHKATVYGIADAGNGNVLVASSLDTRLYDLSTGTEVEGLFPRKDLRYKSLGSLGHNVFLLDETGSLYRWDMDSGSLVVLADIGKSAVSIKPVLDNLFWIQSNETGIGLYVIEKGNVTRVPDAMDPLYFSRNGENDTLKFTDDNGGRWCVDKDGGLYCSFTGNNLFSFLPGHDGANLFKSSIISSVAESADGSVWLGRPGDGKVIMYDPVSADTSIFSGIEADNTKSIVPMGDDILIGFYSGGLQIIDKQSESLRPIQGLNCIRTILPWKEDTVLLASNNDIYLFDKAAENVSILNLEKWNSGYIKKLFISSCGDLWIASERGLQHYVANVGSWKPDVHDFSQVRRATDLAESDDGTIWIATEYGLWSFAPDSVLKEYNDPTELLKNAVLYCIEKDEAGTLWISGSDGLFSFDPDGGYVQKYDTKDESLCSQYATGGSASCHDGRLMFAGVGGVTIVHPEVLSHPNVLSRAIIDKIRYNGSDIQPGNEIVIQKKRKEKVSLSFLIPDILSEGIYSLAYSVDEGKEHIVSDIPASIELPNLKYGRHVVRYKSLYAAAGTSGDERILLIKVKPGEKDLLVLLLPLLAAIITLIIIISKHRAGSDDNWFLSAAKHAAEEAISDKNLSVNSFAEKMGLGKKALYDNMQKYMKTTPSAFIRDTRIRVAKDLLEKTDLPISNIGDKVGFSSTSYFILVFRKSTGSTPFNYRQKKMNA